MFLLLAACSLPSDEVPDDGVIAPIDEEEPPLDTVDTGAEDSAETAETEESATPVEPVEEAPRLVLNEVMSKNECSYAVDGAMPDWIEIYNDSAESVSMDRVALWDGTGAVWVGPAAASIEPGAFYVVFADGAATGAHAPFSLSSEGDRLTLLVDGQVTDRLATGLLDEDMAWARFPDGGTWGVTMGGTAGATNGDGPVSWTDSTANLFSLNTLQQVVVELEESDRRSLTGSPQTYVEAGVSFNGIPYEPVGVRLRGSMTFQPITGKAAFKIDMNRYADATYCGEMEKFNTLNMYYDASLVREYMAYYVFRSFGVGAVRNAYAQVYDGADYIGIELLSETYDDVFLQVWYGYEEDQDWMVWEESGLECELGSCDNSIVTNCTSIFSDRSGDDGELAELEQCMDVDEFLRTIAGELTLGQWDGYCAPHNFRYSYNPVTGLLALHPSSLDLTFDNLGYSYGGDYFQCNGSSLLAWCLSFDTCEERYLDILDELADRIEGGGEGDMLIDATMDQVYALIEPHAASEPRGQYDYGQFVDQFEYVRSYLHALPDDIRAQVDTRR